MTHKLVAIPLTSIFTRTESNPSSQLPRGPENPLHMGGHGFGALHRNADQIDSLVRELQAAQENQHWDTFLELEAKVKELLRTTLKIPETHEIAFDSNTTAFHPKILGSVATPKDKVLIADVEFHALHRSVTAAKETKQIKDISTFKYKTGDTFTKDLITKLNKTKAKVLLISHVPSNRQTFFELTPVLDAADKKGIKVVLDMTQSVGNVVFDLGPAARDNVILLFTGIKYLHIGENFGVCVYPKSFGNTSGHTGWFANPQKLGEAASTQKRTEFCPGLEFNGGTPGTIGSLARAYVTLQQFSKPGHTLLDQHQQIQAQQKSILDALDTQRGVLNRRNCHNYSDDQTDRSNTLIFDCKDLSVTAKDIEAYLASKGVIVDTREEEGTRFIRMGFQPNMQPEDVEFLTKTLKEMTLSAIQTHKSAVAEDISPTDSPSKDFFAKLNKLVI